MDESTVTFKEGVKILQFYPSKPNKFCIKLFMVSEHLSGYISEFSVYTRKSANKLVAEKQLLFCIALLWQKLSWVFFIKPSYWIVTIQFFLTTTSTPVNCWKKWCTMTHTVQVIFHIIFPYLHSFWMGKHFMQAKHLF